jgi:hypothetical protein
VLRAAIEDAAFIAGDDRGSNRGYIQNQGRKLALALDSFSIGARIEPQVPQQLTQEGLYQQLVNLLLASSGAGAGALRGAARRCRRRRQRHPPSCPCKPAWATAPYNGRLLPALLARAAGRSQARAPARPLQEGAGPCR